MLNPELKKDVLWQSEERYYKMIEEIEDYAIILLNTEGLIQNWNRGAQKIKGYQPEEIIGKHFRNFYTPEDRARQLPETLLERAKVQGRALHEGWRLKKDGSVFWGNIVITALHDDSGNVIGYLKLTRDLTERKLAEDRQSEYVRQLEDQRRAEERYHRLVDEVQDYAILLLDRQGNIENWNTGAERIKGYKASEIIGKHFSIFYTEEDKVSGLPQRLLNEALEKGRALHEGRRVRKDGTTFWGSIVITALHDDSNNVIGFSKVTRDLTERKQAEDQLQEYATRLEQKNKELEEFTYVASHDLKEPLRKIITFGELLHNNCKDVVDERANSYVARMQDAARRMMSLIDDLLQFSLVDKELPAMELTDLNQVMERVVQDLEPAIQSSNASVVTEKLPQVMARPLQMQQLFQNLLANSLKFNDKPTPVINITYNRLKNDNGNADTHRISVADNGIGFDSEESARIFEAFRRLHGRSQYAGSGIGLAICKKIVELHNGHIYATGKKGEGATFIIDLPANES